MLITQTADCVDGGWQTDPVEWAGAISGFAQPGRFSGYITLNGDPNGTGVCTGLGHIEGESTDTSLTWTSSTDGHCAGGVAQTVVFRMHR
jgi:hypothetical protein